MAYSVKNAIVDLGFIHGCLLEQIQGESAWSKYIWEIFDRITQFVSLGGLASDQTIYDLGVLRGTFWLKTLPGAYSQAMDRLMEFFVFGVVDWDQLPQPFTGREHEDPVLADELRDEIHSDYACEGRGYAKETARLAGFDGEFIIDRIVPPRCRDAFEVPPTADSDPGQLVTVEPAIVGPSPQSASDKHPISPLPSVSPAGNPAESTEEIDGDRKSPWTPERRAEAAERAKGRRKPPFDDDFADVKADLDAGLSPLKISRKWGCSEQHIRNFLTKHGVEPRRPKPALPEYQSQARGEYEWSDESRNRLFELRDEGRNWKEIGDALGRTPSACSSMFSLLVKQGKAPSKKAAPVEMPPLTDADIEEVQEMLDKDYDYEEIGEWLGCDAESVRQFCQDNKLFPAKTLEEVRKHFAEREAAIAGSQASAQIAPVDDPENDEPVPADGEPEEPRDDLKPCVPVDAETLIERHNGYAGRRDPEQELQEGDWPDIQNMLEKMRRSVSQIASDYDVSFATMREFIDRQLWTGNHAPGEARAPS